MLVTLTDIKKSFLDEAVLRGVSLTINENDRIGLLGVNGVGKSTLLNIITQNLPYDEGSLAMKNGLEIGYLKQNEALNSENTLQAEIESALHTTYALREQLSRISEEIAKADPESAAFKALTEEYERVNNAYLALDGYTADVRIKSVLNGLGFGSYDLNGKIQTLSGGEKMRFAIAKILLRNPELLILDEPTNHLDFTMLSWLEGYLSSYKGAVLIVSHDRYFLDKVASDICELAFGELHRYKGGYSAFLRQKEERVRQLEKEYAKQQADLEAMRDYVRRNLAKSSSTNSVGSRVKALEKMELMQKPNPRQKKAVFKFEFDIEPHKTILTCRNMGVYVGNAQSGRQLFDNLNLEIARGEKVALVGQNGVGKSSFLKAVLRKIPYSGTVQWGGNTKVAYFDQELRELDLNDTVIEAVHRRYPSKTEFEIRSALGRLLIEDEAVFKRVRDLSGANRAKVAFCIIQFTRANVLVLDEPTNHLDYTAKEALDLSLREFDGTLITVSHDRYFLNSVPSKIIEMTADGLQIYTGGYDYYAAHKVENAPPAPAQKAESAQKSAFEANKRNKAEDRKRRAKLMQVEKDMAALEAEIEDLRVQTEDNEVAADYEKLSELLAEIEAKQQALETLELEWFDLSE